MARAFLSVDANVGDLAAQVGAAIAGLEAHKRIDLVRQTKPSVTREGEAPKGLLTHTQVVEINTSLKPLALLRICHAIEDEMGRDRAEVWGPRIVDLDLLVYEDFVVHSARLTLPHPYARYRPHILGLLRTLSPEVAEWVVGHAERPR